MEKRKIIIIVLTSLVFIAGSFVAGYYINEHLKTKALEEDMKLFNMGTYNPSGGESVSIIQLIANPEQYVDKKVYVRGVIDSVGKDHVLYLSKEDFEMGIISNALWISSYDLPPEITDEDIEKLDGMYVGVSGTYYQTEWQDPKDPGVIKDISSILLLGNPKTGNTYIDFIKYLNPDETFAE